jgi:acyl-CoA thioesterase-2
LEQLEEDLFLAPRKLDGVGHVFGGQLIAQALAAAEATTDPGKTIHSLHGNFLRGGSEDHPIEMTVERAFDGGSFSNRRVTASQMGRAIFSLTASFQRAQEGPQHQLPEMPEVPPPEDLISDNELRKSLAIEPGLKVPPILTRPWPVELRSVEPREWLDPKPREARAHVWLKAVAPLPDDPRLHRLVLAFASDMQLLGTCLMPHPLSWRRGEVRLASLDHAVWFHAPFRADEWLLYVTDSPFAGGARGFNRGQIFRADGTLVASTSQEGMVRPVKPSN